MQKKAQSRLYTRPWRSIRNQEYERHAQCMWRLFLAFSFFTSFFSYPTRDRVVSRTRLSDSSLACCSSFDFAFTCSSSLAGKFAGKSAPGGILRSAQWPMASPAEKTWEVESRDSTLRVLCACKMLVHRLDGDLLSTHHPPNRSRFRPNSRESCLSLKFLALQQTNHTPSHVFHGQVTTGGEWISRLPKAPCKLPSEHQALFCFCRSSKDAWPMPVPEEIQPLAHLRVFVLAGPQLALRSLKKGRPNYAPRHS